MTRPVLVFGISGATWNIIEPLIATGRMPNLARLVAQGSSGTLMSMMAPGDHHYRPQVAWPTMATGCTPDRHGMTMFFHEATDLKSETLWEWFNEAGLRVGVFGWPGTWPPSPVQGFVVPSHLARDARTWPPELAPVKALDRLNQTAEREAGRWWRINAALALTRVAFHHRVGLATLRRLASVVLESARAESDARPLLRRRAKLELNTAIFLDLYGRFEPDFAAFVTFYPDFVLHRYWRYREPTLFGAAPRSALATAIDRSFEDVDRSLGRMVARVGSRTVVAVMSEHGMEPELGSPEVGDWFFAVRGDALLSLVGLGKRAAAMPVARWIAYRPIPGTPFPADLAARLRQVVVAETGLPLFAVYEHGADEVVVKFSLSPNVPEYARGNLERLHVEAAGRSVPFSAIARRMSHRRSAMHARDGMIAIAGPGIRKGEISSASIVDVAPTLLHAAGLPARDGLDGSILDIFDT